MSDKQSFRIMKGIAGFSITYLIGWICYGDVAPTWLLAATAVVGLIVGIVVYVIDPQIEGI